jgi:DNA-binding MarR family transcriptional regulator
MRSTSINVYKQIEAEGLLSKRRFEVYRAIYNKGPMTQNETLHYLNAPQSSITPRFAELERMGVIKAIGERSCSITGRVVLVWQTTNNLPVKYEKAKKIKCKSCNGKGYHIEQQQKMF